MTQFLIRSFIPNFQETTKPAVRQRYGMLSGITGIFLNTLLFLCKIIVGLLSGSIAMVGDAVNNLSDAASSVVTLIGFYMAGKAADKEHPFGHGRAEYLAGLVVAAAVMLVGLEIGRSSVGKIIYPEAVAFSWTLVGVLIGSVVVKLWMYFFNAEMGKKIQSAAMRATAIDSLTDVAATSIVLISALIGHFFGLNIDAYAGIVLSVIVLRAGWNAAKDTLNPLLGQAMDPQLAHDVHELAVCHEGILGVHELVYHDYGPGRAMLSFHVEVSADGNLLELHESIDHIEREVEELYHVNAIIHMDPVVCDERTTALRTQVEDLAEQISPELSIHELRAIPGRSRTKLIFDLEIPHGFHKTDETVQQELEEKIAALSETYSAVISVKHSFVGE